MEIVLALFIIPVLCFMLIRYWLNKTEYKVSKVIRFVIFLVFIIFFLFFLSFFILARYNLYYWGYRSHSWIFVAMTFWGMLYFLLRPKIQLLSAWEYLPLMITTIAIGITSILIYAVLWDYKKDLIHKDNQYRIEWNGWFITRCGLPSLFVKDGIFERQMLYTKNYCLSKSGIDSVKMLEITSDTVTVIFYHHSDWKDIPKPIITKAYKQ